MYERGNGKVRVCVCVRVAGCVGGEGRLGTITVVWTKRREVLSQSVIGAPADRSVQ